MDSFDWQELLKGVEELGHGSVRFELDEGTSLKIDTVIIDDEEVLVTMKIDD